MINSKLNSLFAKPFLLLALVLGLGTTHVRADALVQILHNAADPAASTVDIYVNGGLLLDNFAFRTATPFVSVSTDTTITVGVAPGNSASAEDIIATFELGQLEDGGQYVVVATGVLDPTQFDTSANGDAIAFTLEVFAPAERFATSGTVDVLAYHGATDAPVVDIVSGGSVLVDDLAYGNFAGYLRLPASDFKLDVTLGDDNSAIVASYDADLTIIEGQAAIVFASGFLNPDTNQNGAAFGLFAALNDGSVVELPLAVPTAELQVIHNSPDPAADTVDIYVNGELFLNDFAFRTATPFVEVPAEEELIIGVAPGSSASSADAIAEFPVTLADEEKYVVVATGVLAPDSFNTAVNTDIAFTLAVFAPGQTAGTSHEDVEFLTYHGSPDAPAVDVLAGTAPIVTNLSYGNFNPYLAVPADSYILNITPAGQNETVVASFIADLSGLGGGAAVVFASGFLDPGANQDGEAFGLFAALADGTIVEFPAFVEPEPVAQLQVIHNSADPAADTVDIYVNGELFLNDFAFRTATPFVEVPAEVELVIGVAPGTSDSVGDVIAEFPVTLAEDEKYVVVATGVLAPDSFNTTVNADIAFTLAVFAPAQTEGTDDHVDFLTYHGSTDAPAVDVLTGDTPLVTDLSYGNFNPYLAVPAASYVLDITPAGQNDVVVASFTADLSGLEGGAAVVFASGFLDPSANQDGAAFGLFAALPNGTVVEFPPFVEPAIAQLQVIHNASDPAADTVDIYVNGELFIDDFAFRTATPFVEVPAEVELVIGVAPGSSDSTADIIAEFPVTLADGEKYVVVATGVLAPDSFNTAVNADIAFTLAVFAPGQTEGTEDNVDFLTYHGSTDAPAVDVLAGETPIVTDLSYGNFNPYLSVPAASYTLNITPAGQNEVVVASFTADLSGLGGGAAVVFASGFLDPSSNQDGAAFGLFAALPNGTVVEFPAFVEPDPVAQLQVIHNASDPAADTVDIYVNGELFINDFAFRTATPFVEVPAEVELVIGVAPGNSTSADDIIAEFPVTLADDEKYVVVATGVLAPDNFNTEVNDDIAFTLVVFTPAQTAGTEDNVDFLTYHGSTDAPAVDVLAGETPIVTDLSYGNFNPYLSVPAASYTLNVTPAGQNEVVVASFTADLSGLGGGAAVVFASGFLDPSANQDGKAFGLFAALTDGTVVEFPAFTESCEFGIVSYSLVDAEADTVITAFDPIEDGAIIDVSLLTTKRLNIIANVCEDFAVGSVEFSLTGINSRDQIENNPPYAVFSDRDGDYNQIGPHLPGNGQDYVLTGRAYTGRAATGEASEDLTISFSFIESPQAQIQVIHNSADPAAAEVDIYLNGELAIDDFAFRTATPFLRLPAETELVIGVAPGNSQSAEDVIAEFPVILADNQRYIITATGVLDPSQFDASENDDTGFSLDIYRGARKFAIPGNVDVLVYHGSTDAPRVDVLANGGILVDNLNFREYRGYYRVPNAKYTLAVTPAKDNSNVLVSYEADLSGLDNGAAVVFASGFLNPSANQDGAAFGLFAALVDGTVIELPLEGSNAQSTQRVIGDHVHVASRIFPNPATDQLSLRFESAELSEKAEVMIYNQSGVLVFKGSVEANQNNTLNLSGLEAGLYHLRIVGDKSVSSQQLLIQK